MSLQDRLREDMKQAMKAGDKRRLEAVRMTLSELKKAAIDGKKELDEAEEVAIVQRAVKQRREAADAFANGNRPDLATKESEEAEILASYLPRQLDDAQLADAVREAIQATGATGAKDLGKVMGRLMAKYKGHVDGGRAREAIQAALGK